MYLAVKRPEEAVDALRCAAQLKPDDGDIAMHLVESLLATNRRGEAKQLLQTVARSAEDPSEALRMLQELDHSGDEPGSRGGTGDVEESKVE